MSLAVPQCRLILGLRTNIKSNIHYVSDEELLYPVGSVLALHNFTQNRQRIIKLADKSQPISLICLSPHRKIVAICEKGDKPNITLYDTSTLKKKKVLGIPQIGDNVPAAKEFVTIQFTCDSKFLIGITGEPDWMLYCYNWEKGKVETYCKALNPNGIGTIVQVACNPNDPTTICLVGDQLFRLLACAESVWRQWGYSKADLWNLSCVTWLSQERVLAGSVDGMIYFIENGEFKNAFNAYDTIVYNFRKKDPTQETTGTTPSAGESQSSEDSEKIEVSLITGFTRGFCYVCGLGLVHFFEKTTPFKYTKRNMYKIPDITFRDSEKFAEITAIQSLIINLNEDRLIATTLRNQLYQVRLWGPDMSTNLEIFFQPLGPSLHHGTISAIALCAWKPIFITCGELDRTLRVWDYEAEQLLMVKEYEEDVYGVAFHPSGLFAAIGFADKLRYMTVLIDDLRTIREFPIRCCKECAFSSHGHLFAAVNGNVIQVYSTISFENLHNLKGHNGKITALSWSAADLKLVSCGLEGAVYEWDMSNAFEVKRSSEFITKQCPYLDCAVTSDAKFAYALGVDGCVKVIADSQMLKSVQICEGELRSIAKARSDNMVFITGPSGVIYSLKVPLSEDAQYNEYKFHAAPISRMRMSYDDKFLISCSTDGTICIWKLLFTEGKSIKLDKDFAYSTEILISRDELEEKMFSIRELTLRLHEMETEHAYHFRQMEQNHADKMKEVHEGYCKAIEELKEKNEQLETEHTIEINNINADITKMKNGHEQATEAMELMFNEKLINEYDKYSRLEDKLAGVRASYNKQLEDLAQSKVEAVNEVSDGFMRKLLDKDVQIEELHEEIKQLTREHELIKSQIEDDADREILELRASHEAIIKEEQAMNVKLRGETLIMRKKYVAAQKEIDELKHSVHKLESEHGKFQNIIIDLEKDISDLKKEIVERDQTIQEKEKRIYDLKAKNQELEKFRFVLNYKIKELKSQIEPKEQQIHEQKIQINDMVNELETLQKSNQFLDLQLTEMREKIASTGREIQMEKSKVRQCRALLRRMRTDLHEISGLIQEPNKLKTAIREMYHRYNEGRDFQISQVEDSDARNEFSRQREYLERTVRGLKKAATRHEPGKQKEDKMRIVDESSVLISEVNEIRKNYRSMRVHNAKMESLLGISTKFVPQKEAQDRLNAAVRSKEEIDDMYKHKILQLERNVAALREENLRLIAKVLEANQHTIMMPEHTSEEDLTI